MINKDDVKNILIIRSDKLGDVVLTLPLISAAKKVFTDAKIYFFVKDYVKELIEDYKDIDGLIPEENLKTIGEKYRYFKKIKPDLVINVKPRFDLALLFFLLRIKYRIGTGYRWYSLFYNYKVFEHRKVSEKHESDYNLNLLKTFFDETGTGKEFYFKYSDEEKNKLESKISQYKMGLENNFIIIHPGSGRSSKDLPADKFTALVNEFTKSFRDYRIVFTGLENETFLISNIIKSTDKNHIPKIIDLSGLLNLRELMILIDNSKLFISNSTGPIHIAGALNKNIIGFYPNEKQMSDIRWKPLSKHSIIIKPEVDDNMNTIRIDDVMIAASKLLN